MNSPILERSGHLITSILSDSDDTSAVAGTNFVYAARRQPGFDGSDSLGRNIDAPARPFLGVWPEHEELINDAALNHLTKALR